MGTPHLLGYHHEMGSFMGGSAYAMASQISEGFLLITERTFQRMQLSEIDQLAFEIEKRTREIRSDQPDLEDTQALQTRNRKLMRLTQATQMLNFHKQKRRR
jgi:hypothetical protein